MDWMQQLEEGIREALTKDSVRDYGVVVHNEAQAIWGRLRAKEIVASGDMFENLEIAN